jgi:ABC-type nitrate/sulfonate/bicarbonate transport system permease component
VTDTLIPPPAAGRRHAARWQPDARWQNVVVTRVLFAALLLCLWQAYSGGKGAVIPEVALSRPSDIASSLGHLIADGAVFGALGATLAALALALVISIPLAALLALLTMTRAGEWILGPIVTILYAVPKIGLITVFILMAGFSTKTHVLLVASTVMFVYYYSFQQALRDLDQRFIRSLRLFGASALQIGYLYVLRAIWPGVVVATRVAIPMAFGFEVFAELRVPTASGLGVMLNQYTQNLQPGPAMAVLVFIIGVACVIDALLGHWAGRYAKRIGVGVTR